MAGQSHNSSEDTIVTLKDGTKYRKYRTMDGAIKYEKIEEPKDDYQKAYEESFTQLMEQYPDYATEDEQKELEEMTEEKSFDVPGIFEMDELVNRLRKQYDFQWNKNSRPDSIWGLIDEAGRQGIPQDTVINLLNSIQGR